MSDMITCAHCQRTKDEVPILTVHFQDSVWGICPEHLPILIHKPHKLQGKLPGAEKLTPQSHG